VVGLGRKRSPQSAEMHRKFKTFFFLKEDESTFPLKYLPASLLHAEWLSEAGESRIAALGSFGCCGGDSLCKLNGSEAASAVRLLGLLGEVRPGMGGLSHPSVGVRLAASTSSNWSEILSWYLSPG